MCETLRTEGRKAQLIEKVLSILEGSCLVVDLAVGGAEELRRLGVDPFKEVAEKIVDSIGCVETSDASVL